VVNTLLICSNNASDVLITPDQFINVIPFNVASLNLHVQSQSPAQTRTFGLCQISYSSSSSNFKPRFLFLNDEEISQKSQCGFQVSSPKRLVARVPNLFMLGMLLDGFVALIHAGIKEAFESS